MKKVNLIAGLSTAVITAALSLTAASVQAADVLYGDANCDGKVTIADSTAILQHLGNEDKYGLSEQGRKNADVYNRGDGITGSDAISIQKVDAKLLDKLPESWKDGVNPDDAVSDAAYIHLKGETATVEGENVEVKDNVITITHSGSYYVDGTLDDGQINVNVPDEKADPETVKIILNGVDITGKSAPAILVTNAENTSITIADGTQNSISDGDTKYADGGALIEAKDDLTIKGGEKSDGVLTITANIQNAVACNNDIKFTGGITNIKTLNKTDKTNGVNGKKSATIKDDAIVNIDAEGDGFKSSKGDVAVKGGTLIIKAGNDAIQAETTIDISGGVVVAGGDRGLTAVTGVNITGGTVIATATDNQADKTIMSGTTQGTKLFNMAACADTDDGTWKKANAIVNDTVCPLDAWTKKYAFVLMSDPSFEVGKVQKFINKADETAVLCGGSSELKQTAVVTVYDNVSFASSTSVPSTDPTPSTEGAYSITLNGSSIKSDAPSDAVLASSSSLKILQPGVFEVSGDAKDVQIVVDVDKTKYPDGVVELDLMGANISNSTTAPIYVANIGKEVQIVAKKGTENVISDGTSHNETYTNNDGETDTVEGAIFARDDIKFKGSGSLTINGNTDDAVVCKNDIKIYNGNITINAVDDGIRGKDSVTIGNASDTDFSTLSVTIKTQGGDGIKSTATDEGNGIVTINGGTVDINAYADGIQGEQDVVINGGDINIYTYQGSGYTGSGTTTGSTGGTGGWGGRPGQGGPGGGMGMDGNPNKVENSAKGIKATGIYDTAGTTWQSGGNIVINGGNITIDSSDDAIHCGGSMEIYGGQFKIATADDALHADHDLTLGVKGGAYSDFGFYASKCYEGVEAQNIYQYSGTVIVKADDDGYNAAGGSDGSGNTNPGGFFPGGGFGGGGGDYSLNIAGGIAIVQSASGDHDAFDSNGSLTVSGGVVIANGNEPLDSDGTNTANGGTVLAVSQGSTVASGTQFTVADSSGKVIVSFKTMQAMGSISQKHTDGTISMYTGGTVSGGTDLIALDDSQPVYADGTISGGTKVSAGSGSSQQNPWG